MKKKQIRTAAIIALVLLFAVTAVSKLKIEPAGQDPAPTAGTVSPAPVESPSAQLPEASPDPAPETAADPAPTPAGEADPAVTTPEPTPEAVPSPETTPEPEPVPTPTPAPPAETPSTEEPVPERHVCTLEIRCDTVADTSKLENQAVAPYVPADGVILAALEVEFTPGESVFDVLQRATREQGIHMEFRDEAMYSGKYIEGINYLYEFDGGSLSGWMYKVNGQFPNYGCAKYTVADGDAIVWMYTCDLGRDVGDNSTW